MSDTKRLLVYDASNGVGGAMTSIASLLPELAHRNWQAQFACVDASSLRSVVDDCSIWEVRPRAFDNTHGLAYYSRELLRVPSLLWAIRATSPHALLLNNAPGPNFAGYIAAQLTNLPIFQYVRCPLTCTTIDALVLSRARAVFAVGDEASNSVRHSLPPDTPIVTVDEGLCPTNWTSPLKPNRTHWMWSSTLSPWKGFNLLREVFDSLAQVGELATIEICTPQQHPDIQQWRQRYSTSQLRVHYGQTDLRGVRDRCGVYVHTALQPEPFGRSIIESMSAGLCCVVPNEGSGPRLVQHMHNGLIYDARSASSLSSALCVLSRNPELVRRLGTRARMTSKRYQAPEVYSPIIDALDRVVGSNSVRV